MLHLPNNKKDQCTFWKKQRTWLLTYYKQLYPQPQHFTSPLLLTDWAWETPSVEMTEDSITYITQHPPTYQLPTVEQRLQFNKHLLRLLLSPHAIHITIDDKPLALPILPSFYEVDNILHCQKHLLLHTPFACVCVKCQPTLAPYARCLYICADHRDPTHVSHVKCLCHACNLVDRHFHTDAQLSFEHKALAWIEPHSLVDTSYNPLAHWGYPNMQPKWNGA
jgi:hypothetical protein